MCLRASSLPNLLPKFSFSTTDAYLVTKGLWFRANEQWKRSFSCHRNGNATIISRVKQVHNKAKRMNYGSCCTASDDKRNKQRANDTLPKWTNTNKPFVEKTKLIVAFFSHFNLQRNRKPNEMKNSDRLAVVVVIVAVPPLTLNSHLKRQPFCRCNIATCRRYYSFPFGRTELHEHVINSTHSTIFCFGPALIHSLHLFTTERWCACICVVPKHKSHLMKINVSYSISFISFSYLASVRAYVTFDDVTHRQ